MSYFVIKNNSTSKNLKRDLQKMMQQIKHILLVSFFAGLLSCNNQKPEEILSFSALKIDTTSAVTANNYIGSIEGKVNVEISSQVEGILQEIYVDEGQFVQPGQPLFRIDPSAYQEALNDAIANENIEKAKLKNARLEIDRIQPLIDNEVISPVQMEIVRSNYEIAKASLARATAAVASAQIKLSYTTITAPVQGYIGRFSKRIGNLVTKDEKEPLTVLTDVSDVYVYFSMSETDYLFFTEGKKKKVIDDSLHAPLGSILPQATLLLADGNEYPEKGIIDAVSGQVNRSTGSIFLRASFPNSQDIIRSGNTGTIQIKNSQKGVILIPQEAVSTIQDKRFVYALDDSSKVILKPVEIGGVVNKSYIISKGLVPNDVVLTTGFNRIREGMKIKPIFK